VSQAPEHLLAKGGQDGAVKKAAPSCYTCPRKRVGHIAQDGEIRVETVARFLLNTPPFVTIYHIVKKSLLSILAIICVSCNGLLGPRNEQGNQGTQDPGGQTQPSDPTTVVEPDGSSQIVTVDDEATSEDNIANTEFDGTISITFAEGDATIEGEVKNVTLTKDGARVTATNTGSKKVKYILSGTCSDGSFTIYGEKKQAIVLSNLNLTNTQGAAINNQNKKRTFIQIEGTNFLKDGAVNADGDYPDQKADEDMKAVLFSESQLAISGTGTLTVNAVGKAGITSDDYVRLMTGAKVTVNSTAGHGVRGKDAIIITGGEISVTLESSATGRKCFSSDSLLYIGGGATTLTNKASAGKLEGEQELTGAACIKADSLVVLCGGQLELNASGKGCKGISCDANGYFEGGKLIAKITGANYGTSSNWRYDDDNYASAKGLKFDGNLEFTGADVTVSCSYHEAIEAKGTICISDGSIYATASDDAINSGTAMTISGGVVYAYSSGNDGLDANGDLVIKGGTVLAGGTRDPEVGIDANTEEGYRFYLQKGNVIAIGGIEKNSSVSQAIISTSWSTNTTYSLCNGDNVLFTFKSPASGGTTLCMSAPELVSGSKYTLKKNATVTGAESFIDGKLSLGGTASGGTSSSVTDSTYTSSGTNTPGGPGGPHW